MKQTAVACAAAWVLAAGVWLPVEVAAADEDIKLTGCLVRGDGDAAGYLLTNVPGFVARQRPGDATVEPGPVGTAGAATVFYWLEDDDALEPHVGHRIEVSGELEDDVEDGEIEIDRQDNWTEIRIESDGRELKARVPHELVVAFSGARDGDAIDVLVRKVDVEGVRMIAATCDK